MKRISWMLVIFLLVLVVALSTFAQLPTGTILGVVKDSSGAVVPGANLTIRNVDTDVTRTVTTGDDGAFRVPALAVGHYTVTIEKSGFNTETQTGLTLEVDQNLVLNASLQVGTSTQQVTVTGEAPVVNTTSGSIGTTVNEQKIADLPLNGRNWVDLTLMQPGITQHKNIGSGSPIPSLGTFYSSNGAPIRSNNYMIDGAMMVIFYGGVSASVDGSTLGVDGIQEYKVQTSNFSAEYGLTMGSQVTIVSKGGTNSFHGSAFEYLRNSSLDARNFFDSPNDTPAGKRLPPFKRNNFGGAFGGPIKKDRTFFFATFEALQVRQGLTLLGTAIPGVTTVNGVTGNCRAATANPCATSSGGVVNQYIVPLLGNVPGTSTPYFPLPTPGLPNNEFTYPFTKPVAEQYGQLRLDQTISAKDTVFARYTVDHANLFQPVNTTPNVNVTDHLYSSSQFDTISETHIFSPTLVNTARGSLSITEPQNTHQNPPYPCPGTGGTCSLLAGLPDIGIGAVSPGGGITTFPSGVRVSYNQRIWSYSDDAFYTKGRHAIKFGGLFNYWNQKQLYLNSNRGSFSFSNLANMLAGNYASIAALTPGPDSEFGPRRDYLSGTIGVYIQDDFRATSRLTLNLGLRYERLAPIPHEVNDLEANLRNVVTDTVTTIGPPIKNPGTLDFGPRLGFAWDIFGDGKTLLRGGAARLFDIGNLGAALSESARGMPIGTTNLGGTTTTITANQATGACAAPPLVLPFTFPTCWLANTLFALDYNTKQPQLYVFNLTVERQLPGGIGLAVGYVGSRGDHIWTRVDDNPCLPTAIVNGAPDWANPGNLVCPVSPLSPPGATNGRRNQAWSYMNMAQTSSQLWYNALQIVATKRVSHGLQFQGNYTYAHNVDTGNGQQPSDSLIAGGSTSNIAPGFPQFDRGSASFDVKHNFRFNLIYNLPKTSYKGFVGGFVNGWWVSTILSVQSGYPFTPLLSSNRSLSGSLGNTSDRPSLVAGRSLSSITSGTSPGCGTGANAVAVGTALGTPNLWYDPCAFVTEPAGFLGNAGRNILRGPGLFNDDFSLVKDTAIKYLGEAGNLEFRAEFFNIFNNANFSMPGATVLAGTGAVNETPATGAGVITATSTTSRQLQVSLRLSF